MSVGMTKFYRVACFQEIGGFVRQVMWDGIDCHRCRMLGWIAESCDVEPIRFVHLRPQGASQKGIWTGRVRAGFGQYFMGTSPLYYLAVAVHRLPAHPAVIGSLAMLWGYFRSWLKGLPRYDDPEFRRFLRSYQHACLRMGKRAATARTNAERAQLWHASHAASGAEAAISRRNGRVAGSLLRRGDDGDGGGSVPRPLPRPTHLPYRHHSQRLSPLHDAPRPGAGAGLPGWPSQSCRWHVGAYGRFEPRAGGYRSE